MENPIHWPEWLAREWRVIRQAPATFITLVVAVVAVVWWIFSVRYEDRISNQDAKSALLQSRIDAYEKEFPGKTPDQVAERIKNLEDRVDATNSEYWPPLSQEQASDIGKKLKIVPPQDVTIECSSNNCIELANSFRSIFESLNWKVKDQNHAGWLGMAATNIDISPNNEITRKIGKIIRSGTSIEVDTPDIETGTLDHIHFVIGRRYVPR